MSQGKANPGAFPGLPRTRGEGRWPRGLSPRQEAVLEFCREFYGLAGFPATSQDVATRFGLGSRYGARKHMEALAKKGFMRVTLKGQRMHFVPVPVVKPELFCGSRHPYRGVSSESKMLLRS